MKVVAFNGSPRKEGNTYQAIKLVATELNAAGIEVEIIQVGNKVIRGCLACGACSRNKDEKCVIANDEVNEWIQKIKQAHTGTSGLSGCYSSGWKNGCHCTNYYNLAI